MPTIHLQCYTDDDGNFVVQGFSFTKRNIKALCQLFKGRVFAMEFREIRRSERVNNYYQFLMTEMAKEDVFQSAIGNSLARCKTTGATQIFDFDIFFSASLYERPKDGFRYYNAVMKNDGFPENVRLWAYECYKQASIKKYNN